MLQLLVSGAGIYLFLGVVHGPTSVILAAPLTPVRLRAEYRQNPIGIDVREPRLSWQLLSEERGAVQTAYQIQVTPSAEAFDRADCCQWDTGKVASNRSIQIVYSGPQLKVRTRYYWRVPCARPAPT
ncbi:MAG: hypothetical protein P8Y94_17705 [Acidobacteriota bacterium]